MTLKLLSPRFSLRFLLVLTTAAAVLCYFSWPTTDGITEKEAHAVRLQMYPDDVSQAIEDRPNRRERKNGRVVWIYLVKAPLGCEPGELEVEFGPPFGWVTRINRRGRAGFAFPW